MSLVARLAGVFRRAGSHFGADPVVTPTEQGEAPLRGQLFSAEQMRAHGRALAQAHASAPREAEAAEPLLARLAQNEQALKSVIDSLAAATRTDSRIAPAGEWLLDNYFLIEEQIRTARRHLPRGYSRELPRLSGGGLAGLPRVYDIALEAVAHGDGRVDADGLGGFVTAYQEVTVLRLGELWAIPIMLRLALIENLRRVGMRIAANRAGRDSAGRWAALMLDVAARDPKGLILMIADMARSGPAIGTAFVAEFARRLQGQGAALALPLTWVEQVLAESGRTIEHAVQAENQKQAADQVSIANSIGSLRFLEATAWPDFVERLSLVEKKLREDPGGVYARMDFGSRDAYRHVIEGIARRGGIAEPDLARTAVRLAHEAAAAHGEDDRAAHVGHYLIGSGRERLERAAGVTASARVSAARLCRRLALALYLGGIALLAAVFTLGMLAMPGVFGMPAWLLVPVGMLAFFCASQPAVSLVNWLVTRLVAPRLLPRMDFAAGIPPEARTLVVIPTMLTRPGGVDALLEGLEVRYLGNRGACLHFALLTDFADAEAQTRPEDAALLERAVRGVEQLNARYPGTDGGTFFLFHRPRAWNPREGVWMGHERKRGKLADLNALLRGNGDRFEKVVGDVAVLRAIRFVLTLDTDTQLPRGAAHRLAGTIAHPLNQARVDRSRGVVVEGYGILQPRVAASLVGAGRSRYARLFGGEAGIDPYTRAVSDVYQDAFGEGSFVGKGIYDVDVFEAALRRRLPDNRILSHDLIEGCYLRCGLVSDVQVYEEDPSTYPADLVRRHRWIRGDWQLVRWLMPGVPGVDRTWVRNPLSALSRWKLLDNLRRSLMPVAFMLLLLAGWAAVAPAGWWTLAALALMAAPVLIAALAALRRTSREEALGGHLVGAGRAAARSLAQSGFALASLPREAMVAADAVLRTVGRMLVTRRRLLEWTASAEAGAGGGCGGAARSSAWLAAACSLATLGGLAVVRTDVLAFAGPVVVLWLLLPPVARWLGRPTAPPLSALNPAQTTFLRRCARRTWAYFDTFVTAEDHWLPPDNHQEQPPVGLAHRTSPTNMGLALLSNLAACDFGYIPSGRLLERTGPAFATMASLERHRGHFFNWYDTRTLAVLPPAYVSTVDSGNLVGHLLTLKSGLAELVERPIVNPRLFEGLSDTMGVLLEVVASGGADGLGLLCRELETAYDARPTTLGACRTSLARLADSAAAWLGGIDAAVQPEAHWWGGAFVAQCRAAVDDIDHLAPWVATTPGGADLDGIPTLLELSRDPPQGAPGEGPDVEREGAPKALGRERARARIAAIRRMVAQADELAQMDFDFLYDAGRHLLTIGYNVAERRCDAGYYDLLASEARLGVFVAIAQGRLPQESWFSLGRLLTRAAGLPALVSWSGSMFEYLMPNLVMPTYERTLLDQTARAAVARQIEYGRQRGVPWGVSESGYNSLDPQLNYRYRAFGVPGLGLKRGLSEDLVVAPYASALALMIDPAAACLNLQRLAESGASGRHGFYEAVDFTPSRVPRGKSSAVVRAVMAHHAGMSLLAFAHCLLDRPMQRRFDSEPQMRATMLLLQERVPAATVFHPHTAELDNRRSAATDGASPVRVFDSADSDVPEVQLLSNGRYHVMVTHAGGGYSRWKDLALTRWREDGTRDPWGTYGYVRDVASGATWSVAHQPTLRQADTYEAIFSEARVEFRRADAGIETHTEIAVSPEDDVELRRIAITNRSGTPRTIEVTSYAEVVLASPAADALHPAFSSLFVQTEVLPDRRAILCTRRPRSHVEATPCLLHLMAVHGAAAGDISYETDRMRFIGRGRGPADALAMDAAGPLSGTAGAVLDPVVAIRNRITLLPDQTATIDVVTGVGETREVAVKLAGKYQDRLLADRVFELAGTHAQVILQQINATESDARLYSRMAGAIIHAGPDLRADAAILLQNYRSQSGLWGYSISGDLPIVLLQIGDAANIDLVRQLVRAHAYWRFKGLVADLVIWNEDHTGYRQQLNEQIMGLISAGVEAGVIDRPGGIFVRPANHISTEDRIMLQSAARVAIADDRGSLAEQLDRVRHPEAMPPKLRPTRQVPEEAPAPAMQSAGLLFHNGHGGFSADGREYVIATAPGRETPAPWVNVLANPQFGSVVSETGSAYTWSENAHEFRLSPWSCDPVGDAGGEAYYLRDEESGRVWSPMPYPAPGQGEYVTRHGFGYSAFEHAEGAIRTDVRIHVAPDAAVKFTRIRVRNGSGRARTLSVTGYTEWVLGDLRPKTMMHVVTEIDPASGALMARNPYSTDFPGRVAFFDCDEPVRGVCGDRLEFIGRNGTLARPAALERQRLTGRVGAALDPCAAIQVRVELAPGQVRELVFTLGVGTDVGEARALVAAARAPGACEATLERARRHWERVLGTVQVETPDPMFDVMANGWLLYQTLACRLWARSGFYQSGGAFGFRDQLQDSMALVHAAPQLARQQLLLCAAHQFREGDVLHWWHPPTGRGVRTHCSDDYVWLAVATCRYVEATGDHAVLDACAPFIDARPVPTEADSYYDLPVDAGVAETLYEHCVRALERAMRYGAHGLPLIGSGDWNDGMNTVGALGRGESVWLGFFLHDAFTRFRRLAVARGDAAFAARLGDEAAALARQLEQHGWDGAWYRRAFFDDGSPLGSAENAECRIDSIAQSWAVLSKAGDAARARRAMEAVGARLVRREDRLVQLLDPPFDNSALEPGYIKGYVPGVRENGGQYTHAAIWAAMAYAAQGDAASAWEIASFVNPVSHALTPAAAGVYRAEPYAVAADVYALPPHAGRGGWTWYTGSAGWMYRLFIESLLGFERSAATLRIKPCLPEGWPGFRLRYRHGTATYRIEVRRRRSGEDGAALSVDGSPCPDGDIALADDGAAHDVVVLA